MSHNLPHARKTEDCLYMQLHGMMRDNAMTPVYISFPGATPRSACFLSFFSRYAETSSALHSSCSMCCACNSLERELFLYARIFHFGCRSGEGTRRGKLLAHFSFTPIGHPAQLGLQTVGGTPVHGSGKKKTNFAKIAETACRRHCDDEQFHSQLFSPPMRKSMTPKSPRARIK